MSMLLRRNMKVLLYIAVIITWQIQETQEYKIIFIVQVLPVYQAPREGLYLYYVI